MSDSNNPKLLSIRELLSDTTATYRIPMYQRNYAWGMAEIQQLVGDIHEGQQRSPDSPYYIGTLVVDVQPDQPTVFEVIDGQQRLTTLMLLLACLRQHSSALTGCVAARLRFDCRAASNDTLDALWGNATAVSLEPALKQGHELMTQALRDVKDTSTFCTYLLKQVRLLRVNVPPNTDLSLYFEVMNNRGAQLEKHEVLKARLMSRLTPAHQGTFARIWDACADMRGYVHSSFSGQRKVLFTDQGELIPQDFNALTLVLQTQEVTDSSSQTLDDILRDTYRAAASASASPATADRYHAVINFPNFLLQVLNVRQARQTQTPNQGLPELNDKRLLHIFEDWLGSFANAGDKVAATESFAWWLLRCRVLLDQYVIKRDEQQDNFSLRRYLWRTSGSDQGNTFDKLELNKQLLMLQAAFHVSAPTQTYKYWLNAALNWLVQQTQPVDGQQYLAQLESVAQAFVFDRYLSDNKADYNEIIHPHQGRCQTTHAVPSPDSIRLKLTYHTLENNLIFNWLDYLLWRKEEEEEKYKGFRFTFRSSVEHLHPQTSEAPWNDEDLHAFGNLCLIESGLNSRLSNMGAVAKHEELVKSKASLQSIKLSRMFEHVTGPHTWTQQVMQEHQTAMIQVLLDKLRTTPLNAPNQRER